MNDVVGIPIALRQRFYLVSSPVTNTMGYARLTNRALDALDNKWERAYKDQALEEVFQY